MRMRRRVPFAVWIFLLAAILGGVGSDAAQAAACTGWCTDMAKCRFHLFFGGLCFTQGPECLIIECSVAVPNSGALDRLAQSAAPGNAPMCPAPVEQASSLPNRVARVVVLEARL